jgi:hypothetical protein
MRWIHTRLRHPIGWAALLGLAAPVALAAPRTVTPLPGDWRFIQADPEGAETRGLDDKPGSGSPCRTTGPLPAP